MKKTKHDDRQRVRELFTRLTKTHVDREKVRSMPAPLFHHGTHQSRDLLLLSDTPVIENKSDPGGGGSGPFFADHAPFPPSLPVKIQHIQRSNRTVFFALDRLGLVPFRCRGRVTPCLLHRASYGTSPNPAPNATHPNLQYITPADMVARSFLTS